MEDINTWHHLVIMQIVGVQTTIISMVNSFEQKTTQHITQGLILSFCIIGTYAGSYGRENLIDALKKNPLLFFFGFAIWYLQLSLVEKINKEGLDNLQAKLEQKN